MEAVGDPGANKHASVYANDDFICVRSSAGYRSTVEDRVVALLPPDASSSDIGEAVLSALDSYRVLSPRQLDDFFRPERVHLKHSEWEQELAAHAGYRSVKQVYRRLRRVSIRLSGSTLSAHAAIKDRRNGFTGNGIFFTIGVGDGVVAVGEAVKKALEECA